MASEGFRTVLQVTGSAVSMTDEATSDTGNGTLFRIDDSGKEIFDPATSFTVEVNGSLVGSDTYTIRYLTGAIDFDSSQAGNTVTVNGSYLPGYDVAEGFSCSYTRSFQDVDTTVFQESSFSRTQGLEEVSVDISHLDSANNPLDGQGGSEDSLTDILTREDNPLVLELQPSGLSNLTSGTREGRVHRAWVTLAGQEGSSEVDGRYEGSLTFESSDEVSTMSDQSVRLFDSFNP